MKHRARYTAIGYVVSKFVLPVARRKAKQAARRKATGIANGVTGPARRHPGRTSIAVGSVIGAVGWLLTSRSGSQDERDD